MIPEGVTEIGNYLFRGCSKLTAVVIPETVETIGRYAFSRCAKMERVQIPASVAKIGSGAFADCGMWSVTFLGGAPVIAANAFENVQASAFYPQSADGWNRKTIAQYGGSLTWEAISIN